LTAPNVRAAQESAETDALEARYANATRTVAAGAQGALGDFEHVVATQSQAVIGRPATEAFRLAVSDQELYASFYALVAGGIRAPSGGHWDNVREAVDARLFNYYKEKIRFAALTLDRKGLSNYGECFLVLKNNMIEQRSTVFEENSVLFMSRHHVGLTEDLPKGYRAIWSDRARLAVAKLAGRFTPAASAGDYPGLLLHNGVDSSDDDFIEVHIYGSFSIHAVAGVHLCAGKSTGVRIKALAFRLGNQGIPFTKD
jgi:hypothetical protein